MKLGLEHSPPWSVPLFASCRRESQDVIVRNIDTEQEVHLVQTITVRTSTKQIQTKTRISPLGLLPTQNDESRNSQTSDRTGTTQRSTLSTTTDDNTDTQQLPWRVAKIINIHNLWSWILCQIQCQQLLTENQIPLEILMTPSDKLNWVKNEGQLTCYLKISHDTEASWTLLHPLSLPWSPGLLLHTLPHAVVWESANQCFRISGMTLRQAAGPLLS